jgi:hypothetical protein
MVARCEGVASHAANGSVSEGSRSSPSPLFDARNQAIAEIPASSMMILTPVHTTLSPVGRLPISGS